ncbi:hypothetical protein [Kribbella sp. NPDC049227]|uniref:hypothetical protein n=1 Tax=Kribbella sp. NPDC049227 TaxID=3364113 RepID=UPI00371777C6
MSQTAVDESRLVRVRVWFGQLAIIDRTTAVEPGTEFARAIGRRFFGLPVTIEPIRGSREGVEW